MNIIAGWLYFSILGVLFVIIPIMIGVYVYRDAGNRGMNATLWTLIAVLAPGFIGLIIYLRFTAIAKIPFHYKAISVIVKIVQ